MLAQRRISLKDQGITIAVLLFLAICLLILAFVFQGSRGIWQPDEGYYVGAAVTMLDRGDVLIPRLGEEIFLEKPPMTYWGIMAGLKLFGHNELGARSFNALCYVATALTVGLLGYYLFGKKRDAVIASFIYATMALPFVAANFVTPDTPLVLWTTVAALLFWKSIEPDARYVTVWKLLMCVAVGLGFLCKGPAVLIPCGGMFVFLAIRRQVVKYFFTPWALAGFLIFCIVGLSWYFWVAWKVPGAGTYFFDNQVWGRLITSKYNRNPGITGALIYLPILTLGSFPWCLAWWRQAGQLKAAIFKKSWWINLSNRPAAVFLLTWFFVPLFVLSLASSKLGFYALPVFPALALATSQLWVKRIHLSSSSLVKERIRVFARPAVLTGCWILLLLGSKFALAHYYPTQKDARALWISIRKYLPKEKYEIVTIDQHTDGLLFYGVKETENVTRKENPYPTFAVPEDITTELQEMALDDNYHVFLVGKTKHLAEIRSLLAGAGVTFKQIELPYKRWLLICNPSDKNINAG